MKSAAFDRLPPPLSFFDVDALLFLADVDNVGKLSKLSVSELESILGEGDAPTAADPFIIAPEMDDFLDDDDDGVGVRSLLADAILGRFSVVSLECSGQTETFSVRFRPKNFGLFCFQYFGFLPFRCFGRNTTFFIHRYFSEVLESSPGLWAAIAAIYCPSRAGELPKQNMTKSHERWDGKLCSVLL